MYGTGENPDRNGGSYSGNPNRGGANGYGGNGGSKPSYGKSRIERDKWNRPLLPCPLPCTHKVPYASATYCVNFRKDTKPIRKDKVKKYKMCPKCLKKSANHTIPECKARNCTTCGGEHHDMICDQEGGQQKMFNTKEEDNQ